MAEWQHFIDFQDGGGGHLAKWRHTSALAFFGISMLYLLCVSNFNKIS
jgi:hypothetical protein